MCPFRPAGPSHLCAPSVQQVKTVGPSHFGTVFPAFPVLKVLLAYVCNEYEEERRGALSIVPHSVQYYTVESRSIVFEGDGENKR